LNLVCYAGNVTGSLQDYPTVTRMLTNTKIRSAKPREKAYKLADDRGLTLLVQPGGARWWRFRYRWQGREKMLSLGIYPDVPLADARERRDEARRLLAQGIDPSAHRKAERAALSDSFEAVALEWLAAGCPGGRGKEIEAGTVEQLRHRLNTYVFPYIGNWPVAKVDAPELLKLLRRIEGRGRHETAGRVRGLCSRVFRYAIGTGRASRDPASDLKGTLVPAKRRSFPAITNPKRFGFLLRTVDQYGGQPVTRAALQLLALLFVRPGELRLARWGEFDLDGQDPQWVIPAARMKMRLSDHVVPLSRSAIDVLADVRPLTDRGPESLVLPGLRPGRPLSENSLNVALRTMGFSGAEHVAHGFRSTASTLLHELGYASDVIEAQLAHARPGVGGVYNRSHLLPQRRKLMVEWAAYLDGLRADTQGNVTALRA
jgi:integrase